MHVLRFIGVALGLGIVFGLSSIFQMSVYNMASLCSFILVLDHLTHHKLASFYMRSVAKNIQIKEMKKDDDHRTD